MLPLPPPQKNIPSPAKKRPNEKRSWRSSFEGGSAAALAGEEGDRGREEKGRGRGEEGEFCHWRAGRTNGERREGRKKKKAVFEDGRGRFWKARSHVQNFSKAF